MSKNVKVLVYCALCIALAAVTSRIKVFEFPTGGSITLLSMLFAALPGYFFGPAIGITSGVAYGLLQFSMGPYILTPIQVIIDYPLAFGALGLSGFFAKQKHGLYRGYLAACLGRWFFAFLSGFVFFGSYAWEGWNPAAYSAVYNFIYIGSEAVITLILLAIPALRNAIDTIKKNANEGVSLGTAAKTVK